VRREIGRGPQPVVHVIAPHAPVRLVERVVVTGDRRPVS
jgi:hypothetical protein